MLSIEHIQEEEEVDQNELKLTEEEDGRMKAETISQKLVEFDNSQNCGMDLKSSSMILSVWTVNEHETNKVWDVYLRESIYDDFKFNSDGS